MLKPFLQCMLDYTTFLQLIEQLALEHVCHGQLTFINKR